MNVDAMLRDKKQKVLTCNKEVPLFDCIRLMNQNKIGAIVVTDESGSISGIITERDVLGTVDKHQGVPTSLTVEEIMTPKRRLITAKKNQTVEEVMQLMTNNRIRHMPVIEDDKLIGIISIGDVVKTELEKVILENKSMKNYIAGS